MFDHHVEHWPTFLVLRLKQCRKRRVQYSTKRDIQGLNVRCKLAVLLNPQILDKVTVSKLFYSSQYSV